MFLFLKPFIFLELSSVSCRYLNLPLLYMLRMRSIPNSNTKKLATCGSSCLDSAELFISSCRINQYTKHVLAHGRDHDNLFSNLLGILKFENISLFTYKIKNDKSNTPAVLLNILTSPSETHSHNIPCMLQITNF